MSGETSVAEKVHSELGASVASRWMTCPGSVRMARSLPKAPSSVFAEEGTRAHSLAELCLTKGVDPEFFVGMEVEGVVVDEDMAEFVKVYTDLVKSITADPCCTATWVERKFNLGALNPPGPMFGTADFVAYYRSSRTMLVADLKYGQGVVVEAKGNKQLRYYALGAALSLDPEWCPIESVTMYVVQPRAAHPDGVIRCDTISYVELVEFAAELMEAARKTQAPDAPLVAGDHCRFCPASGPCPAQRDRALAIAQNEFSVEPDVPPAPEAMPIEMVLEMLPKLDVLEAWIKAMRAHVFGKLERGEEVPGFKLVAKRATRKWGDAAGVGDLLKADGYDASEIYDMDLKSPAQIEKVLGKKEFAATLAQFVVKQSSGYKMAPLSDPAPAVSITRGEEFGVVALLESGDE